MAPSSLQIPILVSCLLAASTACTSPEGPGPTNPPNKSAAPAQLTLEQIRALHPVPRFVVFSPIQLMRGQDGSTAVDRFLQEQLERADPPQVFEVWVREELDDSFWSDTETLGIFENLGTQRFWHLGCRVVNSPGESWGVYSWGLRPLMLCALDSEPSSIQKAASTALEQVGIPSFCWTGLWEGDEEWASSYILVPSAMSKVAATILAETGVTHWGRSTSLLPDDRVDAEGNMRLVIRKPADIEEALLSWPNRQVFPEEPHSVELLVDMRLEESTRRPLYSPPVVGQGWLMGFDSDGIAPVNAFPGFQRNFYLEFPGGDLTWEAPEGVHLSPLVSVLWREAVQFELYDPRFLYISTAGAKHLETLRDREIAGLPAEPAFHPPLPAAPTSEDHPHGDRRVARMDLPGYEELWGSELDRIRALLSPVADLGEHHPPPQALEFLARRDSWEQTRELVEGELETAGTALATYRFCGPTEGFRYKHWGLVVLRFLRAPEPLARFEADGGHRLLGEASALLWERWIPCSWSEDETGAVLEVPRDLVETAASLLEAEPHLEHALLGPW